jgi:ABC-type Fe3+-hydroxamate transport system substrate-binding protein
VSTPRIRDALGRPLRLPRLPPRRIVSLVPSQTELLFDLGLGDAVVGVTKFCERPEEARRERVRVGGTKTPDIARIRALRPDLVVANREENRAEDIATLEGAGIRVWVSDVRSLRDALSMLRGLGRVLGNRTLPAALAAQIAAGFARLRPGPPRRAAYLIWRRPWMVAGGDTLINDLMRRSGLRNVFGYRDRYPEVSADELREAAPELLLLASEPYPFKPEHAAELAAACPGAQTVHVDGQMFCWFGSRLRAAPAYLEKLLRELRTPGP